MNRVAANFLVFRDSRELLPVQSQRKEVQELVRHADSSPESALEAFLRTAELECGLADASDACTPKVGKLTDSLAALVVQPELRRAPDDADAILQQVVPATSEIKISRPEGFSYYALHPLSFAKCTYPSSKAFAVVGIRSVGVSLSAITCAALMSRGQKAERITVRPTGHPYDRVLKLSHAESRWVASRNEAEAHFLVVDEGPGLSGSSFLSVGDALTGLGVPENRITFTGTRAPDPATLCARDAGMRWQRFRWQKVPDFFGCPPKAEFIGEGRWRSYLLPKDSEWPASWLNMERVKFLSHDRWEFLKFDGLGRYGRAVLQRNEVIHEQGFGTRLVTKRDGMSAYERIWGEPLSPANVNADVLKQIAAYCVFRARSFSAPDHNSQLLAEMTRHNVREELGIESQLSGVDLETDYPVITDSKMQPWEWIRDRLGTLIKVDAATHGDDHFYPGPTDIAWDLAGTIVEWDLDQSSASFFLAEFRRRGGRIDPERLRAFLIAYCAFRVGYCRMAAVAIQDPIERIRLVDAAHFYRNRLGRELASVKNPLRQEAAFRGDVRSLPR
jgi:hypothetical protein